MAKKKKNKQNDHARQKIEETRRRNEYFKRLKVICDMIHPDLYPMLNEMDRTIVHMVRGLPFKIVVDGKVPKEVEEGINEYARMVQKEEAIPLGEHIISLTDYHRYLWPLEWMIRPEEWDPAVGRLNPERFEGLPWYKHLYETREERFRIYHEQIENLLLLLSNFMSDLRYDIYYAYFEKKSREERMKFFDATQHSVIHVQPRRAERKRIKIRNGEMRNALRLTIALPSDVLKKPAPEDKRFFEFSIPPLTLGVKGLTSAKPRPVYVSEHALNRLDERTGCAIAGFMQMYLCHAILKGPARQMRDGRLLLNYEAYGHKIGYLVLSVQSNSILIHTFLLLTANGTPEGHKLRDQLGLQKADNEYLGIDKLSTFIFSDILQHEDVCELFRNAGCESLLKICEELKEDELWQQDSEQIRLAERLKKYLKTGEQSGAWDFTEAETEAEEAEEAETETEQRENE